MPSLLDQVLERREHPQLDGPPDEDTPHQLLDGSIVYDSTISALNRILDLNPHLHKRPTGDPSCPFILFNGHQPLRVLDDRTLLGLLRADFTPKTKYQLVFLEQQLFDLAPTLSFDCFVVSEGLLWDKRTGELRTFTEADQIKTIT